MFLNPWSIALTLCGLLALALGAVASRTALRVLRFWDLGSDSNRQISLEGEIWLSSTLMAYGLGFQIVTLFLFVLAADQFAQAIAGAMCATGSLLASPYGVPTLLVKLCGLFFYGFWLLLHQLDIRSEHYPLVRSKYLYLLLRRWRPRLAWSYSLGWLCFLPLALVVITTVVSSYVYAMPYHKCPFCLLKPEYHYFGLPLYGSLLLAGFFGMSAAPTGLVRSKPGLARVVDSYQRLAVKGSLLLLVIFAGLSWYHFLKYLLVGGEG